MALKTPRTPESAAAVRREAEVLRDLVDRAGPETLRGIPRFLFLEDFGGTPVLGETAFTGVPLLSAWTDETYGAVSLKAASWLADLAGQRPPKPPEQWRARLVDATLDDFVRTFGQVLDGDLLREARRLLEALPALPPVCEQRDFSPWNVLLTPAGELVVVDWESAELDGLPVLDLVYFLTNVCFSLDSARQTGRYRDSYRAMLDPAAPRGSLAERCMSLYCRRLGLDPAVVRPLRVLTWMVHARSEYLRLQADFGETPGVEALRNAVCVQLVEEEFRSGRERNATRV